MKERKHQTFDLRDNDTPTIQEEIRELRAAIEDLSAVIMGAITRQPIEKIAQTKGGNNG